MVTIPFKPSIANQTFSTTIEDEEYRFSARWNSRAGQWRMDVFDAEGNAIIRGVAIVLGTYLGRTSTHRLFRNGVFVALDTTQTGTEATLDDLGTRVVVRYCQRAELIARFVNATEAET